MSIDNPLARAHALGWLDKTLPKRRQRDRKYMPDVRPYLIAERYGLSSYRKSGRKDWLKTLIYIAIYLTFLGFTGIYLLLSYWYVWMALAAGGLIIFVFWHAKATAYHCPRCGYEFEISIFTDFFSHHGVDREGAWKYLKCPNCSNRSRMEILFKTTDKKAIQSQ